MTDKVEKTANTDANGMIKPVRPRRLSNDILPREGSNHMGKLRRELVNTFNSTVVSGRHVDEFFNLMLAVTKETKSFMQEQKTFEEDKRTLAEQLQAHKEVRNVALAEARKLEATAEPLVTVFQYSTKAGLDEWAETHNIKLDARKDLEFMQMDFVEQYGKLNKGDK